VIGVDNTRCVSARRPGVECDADAYRLTGAQREPRSLCGNPVHTGLSTAKLVNRQSWTIKKKAHRKTGFLREIARNLGKIVRRSGARLTRGFPLRGASKYWRTVRRHRLRTESARLRHHRPLRNARLTFFSPSRRSVQDGLEHRFVQSAARGKRASTTAVDRAIHRHAVGHGPHNAIPLYRSPLAEHLLLFATVQRACRSRWSRPRRSPRSHAAMLLAAAKLRLFGPSFSRRIVSAGVSYSCSYQKTRQS